MQEELDGIDVLAKHSVAAFTSLAGAMLVLLAVYCYNWLTLSGGVAGLECRVHLVTSSAFKGQFLCMVFL